MHDHYGSLAPACDAKGMAECEVLPSRDLEREMDCVPALLRLGLRVASQRQLAAMMEDFVRLLRSQRSKFSTHTCWHVYSL